ncbi:MAG: phosphopyruvate hydratase, partial [Thermodesulfobacteriota bacterium]
MSKIKEIRAREILSSGGAPSIEVVVRNEDATGRASFIFGASAGIHEAFILWDNDPHRYLGKGMLKAINNIREKIAPMLIGRESTEQEAIDKAMIDIDGTENKSSLGSNAILTVSMAVAHASANSLKIPLYEYIRKTYNLP